MLSIEFDVIYNHCTNDGSAPRQHQSRGLHSPFLNTHTDYLRRRRKRGKRVVFSPRYSIPRPSDWWTKIHIRSIDVLCAGRVNEIHIPKTRHLSPPPPPPPPSYNYICGEEKRNSPPDASEAVDSDIDRHDTILFVLLFCFNPPFLGAWPTIG